jgi:predicted Zn-dependent protease with MMP-like domain
MPFARTSGAQPPGHTRLLRLARQDRCVGRLFSSPLIQLRTGCQGESQRADVDDDSFEDLVDEAVARIPEPFQSAALRTVAIVVEDEPTASQLASAGARGLFGLYQGVPRTAWGADAAMVASKITIFRGPLRRAHPTPAALATAVDDVIRHEIAHHLGIDDQRLIALRRQG